MALELDVSTSGNVQDSGVVLRERPRSSSSAQSLAGAPRCRYDDDSDRGEGKGGGLLYSASLGRQEDR